MFGIEKMEHATVKRYYCTYFDRNYLFKAMSLIESLNKHESDEFKIFIICLDEISRVILQKLNLANVILIPLHQIEERELKLIEIKKQRTLVEYYFTITPVIIYHIIGLYPEIDILTYLDADLYFFSSPQPIFEELGNQSVLIHEHRYSPEIVHLEPLYGKYNVGLLCFRNDNNGMKVLKWWYDRCIEWCYNHLEEGKFADQAYLNDWTTRFDGVVVLQHIGCGVAPWNHIQYRYTSNDDTVLINGLPLIFYHFHALSVSYPNICLPVKYTNYPLLRPESIRWLYFPYLYSLLRQIFIVQSILSDFKFGLESQVGLSNQLIVLARHGLSSEFKRLGLIHLNTPFNNEWDAYYPILFDDSSRKYLAELWLNLPSDLLEKAYTGDMGNLHRKLMESNLRNEKLTHEENAFLQHVIAELTKRSGTDPVSAINYLLAAMLYLPSDRLKIENARTSLPGWLIGDYEKFFCGG